jgi:UDP-N-acetylglucosamine--N-acetylmuramyl-(pentapeptide) pyrophosphoryl-undecaprenol N-acetylglucosamine transferase
MSEKGLIMLAAGGTGGHLFPAQALAEELTSRGYHCDLVTDERVRDYGKSFPARKTHVVEAATLSLTKPFAIPQNALKLFNAFRHAKAILRNERPRLVVGFGGYPSYAPVRAAISLGLPSIIHEQNAVMGRANRALAKRVTLIAGSFPAVRNLPQVLEPHYHFTGNPVRNLVLRHRNAIYPENNRSDPFRLLVFGGSQGARFFSDFMPGAIGLLDADTRHRVIVTQQCRPEDIERTRQSYSDRGVIANLAPFFSDLSRLMAESQLVICRSGASTIAELGVIGRPAIMVPLPGAIDNDQLFNARSFSDAGGGWLFPQTSLNETMFAAHLTDLLSSPSKLQTAANAALRHGKPDAAVELANLVEEHARVR